MLYFNSTLRKLRMEKGLSQEALAKELGITSTKIANLEANYISPDEELFKKIIEYFDVTSDYFGSNEVCELSSRVSALSIPIFAVNAFENDIVCEADELGRKVIPIPPESDFEYFAITVPDDSLKAHGISRGNTLIIRGQTIAEDGSVVLARLPEGDVVLRKYYRSGNKVTLTTGDRFVAPVTYSISEPKLKIWGKAVSVIVDI